MFPLNDGDYSLIDQEFFLAEAVVSVRDSGRWIANIDVVGGRPEDCVPSIACQCNKRSYLSRKHTSQLILGKKYWIHPWLLVSSELAETGRRDWRPSVY